MNILSVIFFCLIVSLIIAVVLYGLLRLMMFLVDLVGDMLGYDSPMGHILSLFIIIFIVLLAYFIPVGCLYFFN